MEATEVVDDLESYREYSNYIDEAISEFLNMNTTDVISYVANGTFDDLKTTSANQTSAGAWAIDDGLRVENPTGKTRWAVKSAAETGAPFTGNYLQNDIPYGTNNKLYEATVHQTIENMPAAQYMFTIKTRGYKFTSKTAKTTEIHGMKVFINNDSTECYPVEEENATRFTVYSTLADGTWQEYTKTGKDNANVLPKWNNDGLSDSTRSTLLMTANGTLDFYQSSTNSTMQIYYLGITKAENVTLGVRNMETATQRLSNGSIYDLSGRKVSGTKPCLYIRDGK